MNTFVVLNMNILITTLRQYGFNYQTLPQHHSNRLPSEEEYINWDSQERLENITGKLSSSTLINQHFAKNVQKLYNNTFSLFPLYISFPYVNMNGMYQMQTIQIEKFIFPLQFILCMLRIGLKTLQLVVLLTVVCLIPANCDAFEAVLTCQKCKKSCNVANCIRLAAGGYDHETCPQTSCESGYNQSLVVDKCAYDFQGNTCQTNVCVSPGKKGYCATDILGITTCDSKDTYYYEQKCVPCTDPAIGVKCLQITEYHNIKNIIKPQTALGDTCKGVPTVISYIYPCTRDIYGGSCKCCANITSTGDNPKFCSNYTNATSNNGFYIYAYNRSQYNSSYNSTNFEAHHMFVLALFCFMFFFM